MTKHRLDVALVERGLVPSRTRAKQLIESGSVTVSGDIVTRPASKVGGDAPIDVTTSAIPYVGRGGLKLEYALSAFGVTVAGRTAVDLGASTGGFTDCLLQHGAASVVAIDVGTDQLAQPLRMDRRVTVLEQSDVRTVDVGDSGGPFDVVVADLSFISLTSVMASIREFGHDSSDYILLVKPQFETGRSGVNRRGIVRDPAARRAAVGRVVDAAEHHGLALGGCVASPITGGTGNVEFLVRTRRANSLASWCGSGEDAADECQDAAE